MTVITVENEKTFGDSLNNVLFGSESQVSCHLV